MYFIGNFIIYQKIYFLQKCQKHNRRVTEACKATSHIYISAGNQVRYWEIGHFREHPIIRYFRFSRQWKHSKMRFWVFREILIKNCRMGVSMALASMLGVNQPYVCLSQLSRLPIHSFCVHLEYLVLSYKNNQINNARHDTFVYLQVACNIINNRILCKFSIYLE